MLPILCPQPADDVVPHVTEVIGGEHTCIPLCATYVLPPGVTTDDSSDDGCELIYAGCCFDLKNVFL